MNDPKSWPPEIRLDEDGVVDEIVGSGFFHLERLDDELWWFGFSRDRHDKGPRLTWTMVGGPPEIGERVTPEAGEQELRDAEADG